MRKLLQYLKPFAGAIAAAVALVFLQAMCDLKLPDYMSDMVNVGIQQGGITDPVPEQTSPETMDRLLLFFTEEEEALLNQDYRREDSLWTRTGKLSAPDRETLSAAFTLAFAAVGSIETLSKDPDSLKALLAQLPAEKRGMFVRRYWYFDSVSQIASRFGTTENRVSVTLHRLRSKLHDHLLKGGFAL